MCEPPIFLNDSELKKYLSWDTLVPAIEGVLSDVSFKEETQTIQPPRLIMPVPSREGAVLCMPSFSGERNILGCKVVSSFRKNADKGLPSIFGTILLMDSDTGRVKMILEGGEITAWRTAGASVVATKHLHRTGDKKVLAIVGAGVQGRIHALALQHAFNFNEVRIWNRTFERARKLCEELGSWARPYDSNELCVRGADVIVTATYSPQPVVKAEWLKSGVHINAVGFGVNHHNELSSDVYQNATVVVDSLPAARNELKGLVDAGVFLCCELGEVIRKTRAVPQTHPYTVFHSLGMSLEDVITAELIYKKYMEAHK